MKNTRCKRCWKINPPEIHTCTPYFHYQGVSWYIINKEWQKIKFKVLEVNMGYWFMIIKLLNWKKDWNIISLYFSEIDDNVIFDL